jgi:hypothetical protein
MLTPGTDMDWEKQGVWTAARTRQKLPNGKSLRNVRINYTISMSASPFSNWNFKRRILRGKRLV